MSLRSFPPLPPEPTSEAFTRIFQVEFAYVWASLRRFGVRERDLEDVTHDLFLRVYDKWSTYDASRPVRPWLLGFAYRAASDYRRLARHRIELLGVDDDAQSLPPIAEEAMAQREDVALVEQALASLDLKHRAVLVAHELDELPVKDIAKAFDVPLFTAYSRLRLARRQFASVVRRLRARRGEP